MLPPVRVDECPLRNCELAEQMLECVEVATGARGEVEKWGGEGGGMGEERLMSWMAEGSRSVLKV